MKRTIVGVAVVAGLMQLTATPAQAPLRMISSGYDDYVSGPLVNDALPQGTCSPPVASSATAAGRRVLRGDHSREPAKTTISSMSPLAVMWTTSVPDSSSCLAASS